MTVKLVQDQSTPSSSEEDVVANSSSSEEEDEETDSESETEPGADSSKPTANYSSPVANLVVLKPLVSEEDTAANSSSSEEEETDSESETEPVVDSSKPKTTANSSSRVAIPVVKPPLVADSNKVQTSQKLEAKKRSSEADEGEEAKRVKRVSGEDDKKGVEEETKQKYFQRVWTEEDEIVVLQGIIDYKNETGSCPFDDENTVYEFVKKSISFDVTKTQLMEKIRALKNKFEKKKVEGPAFSNPNDNKLFHLSKFVWGDDGTIGVKKVEPPVLKNQEFDSILEALAPFGVDGRVAKKGWSRLSWEDKKTFEEQWEALGFDELKFYSRKSGIIHDLMTKMAEACQPNH